MTLVEDTPGYAPVHAKWKHSHVHSKEVYTHTIFHIIISEFSLRILCRCVGVGGLDSSPGSTTLKSWVEPGDEARGRCDLGGNINHIKASVLHLQCT